MDSRVSFASYYKCTVHNTCIKEMKRHLTAPTRNAALQITTRHHKKRIWDIYGRCTYDIFKKGTTVAADSDDFCANRLSLEPSWKKLCPGFYIGF